MKIAKSQILTTVSYLQFLLEKISLVRPIKKNKQRYNINISFHIHIIIHASIFFTNAFFSKGNENRN